MFFVGILDEKIFERISGTNQFSEGFQSFWVIFYNNKKFLKLPIFIIKVQEGWQYSKHFEAAVISPVFKAKAVN